MYRGQQIADGNVEERSRRYPQSKSYNIGIFEVTHHIHGNQCANGCRQRENEHGSQNFLSGVLAALYQNTTKRQRRRKLVNRHRQQNHHADVQHITRANGHAIKNAVESGLGIGCLSEIVLKKNFANGDLVPLELPKRNMRRTFYFALPRNSFHLESVEAWMRICKTTDG